MTSPPAETPGPRAPEPPQAVATTAGTGVALYAVEYHDVDAAGAAYTMRYLLSLTYARHDDRWLLLHDQNTPTP